MTLNRPPQGTGAEIVSESFTQQEFKSGVFPFHCPLLGPQSSSTQRLLQFVAQNCPHRLAAERVEDDYPVETVDELTPERPVHGTHDIAR